MKVTKQNYERFLIDFMDGNLEPSMEEAMLAFLDENPDIKAEFDDLEIIDTAIDKNISFDLKANLKKPQIISSKNIDENNYEEFLIASTEGDLTTNQEMELGSFIAHNPQLAKTRHLLSQSKVQPDLSIHYPNKKALKKYSFYLRRTFYYTSSVAASILILLSVFFFNKGDDQLKQKQLAKTEKRLPAPDKMNYISEKIIIISETEEITLQFRTITKPNLAHINEFIFSIEDIQQLQARINTKEQLAALKPKFKPTKFILQKDIKFMFFPIQNTDQTKYAQNKGKNKKVVKSIWKGLFAKNTKRENESGSDNKNTKKVGPLWVLANIGLERVNEVTGTNMRLNLRASEGNRSSNDEKPELEISKSTN